MKAALFSGGKDSVYAALLEWPVDIFVTFVYEFPRPSPHLLNLPKVVELANALGVPLAILKVDRGRELEQEAAFLRKLGVSELVAGDQAVEDHLKYMERLAGEAGARLREPLWGLDPGELLLREAEAMDFLVIGAGAADLVCDLVGRRNAEAFLGKARALGMDPIGERGEYHTLAVRVGGRGSVSYRCRDVRRYGDYYIALL
ncbi:MAG: ATPase [Thermoproteus sp.]|nr:ATPase [Thermoproteus sp.]MDT7881421.1 ATPase [Thermoproteus sp.]